MRAAELHPLQLLRRKVPDVNVEPVYSRSRAVVCELHSIAMCCFVTRQCADRTRDPETWTCPRSIGPAPGSFPLTDRLPGFLAQNEFVGHGDGSIGSWPRELKARCEGPDALCVTPGAQWRAQTTMSRPALAPAAAGGLTVHTLDMDTVWLEIALIVVAICANGYFAGSEIAVVSSRPGRLTARARPDGRERRVPCV